MTYIIAGLGNPGEEYVETRHNTGRIAAEIIAKEFTKDFANESFKFDKKLNAAVLVHKNNKIPGGKITIVLPETFMNNSGKAIRPLIKTEKAAEKLIVIYDDFNLPIGKMKISFNRSSGGHNGVLSIIKNLKTEKFVRIRIGTAPETAKGLAKVPHGDEKIEKFILGKFKPEELKEIKKIAKKAAEAIQVLVKDSKEKAMSVYNA